VKRLLDIALFACVPAVVYACYPLLHLSFVAALPSLIFIEEEIANLRLQLPNLFDSRHELDTLKRHPATDPVEQEIRLVQYRKNFRANLVRTLVQPFWMLLGITTLLSPAHAPLPHPTILSLIAGADIVWIAYAGEGAFLLVNAIEYHARQRVRALLRTPA
jgi:hypothetical protein